MTTLSNLLNLKRGSVVLVDDNTIACVMDTNFWYNWKEISYFKYTYLTQSGFIGIKEYEVSPDYECTEIKSSEYDALGIIAELR